MSTPLAEPDDALSTSASYPSPGKPAHPSSVSERARALHAGGRYDDPLRADAAITPARRRAPRALLPKRAEPPSGPDLPCPAPPCKPTPLVFKIEPAFVEKQPDGLPKISHPPEALDGEASLSDLTQKAKDSLARAPLQPRRGSSLSGGTLVFLACVLGWLIVAGAVRRGWIVPSLPHPVLAALPWVAAFGISAFGLLAWRLIATMGGEVAATILGLSWDINAFSRGWFITGDTGSGKTAAAVMWLLHTLFQRQNGTKDVNPWGGLFVDEKGSFGPKVAAVGETYGRRESVRLIQTRPMDAADAWRPEFTMNLLEDDLVPANTYAELIVGTAASQEGKAEGNSVYFKTQAQVNIGWAIQLQRAAGRCQKLLRWSGTRSVPTLASIYSLLSSQQNFEEMMVAFGVLAPAAAPTPQDRHEQAMISVQGGGAPAADGRSPTLVDGPLLNSEETGREGERLREALQHFSRRYWPMPEETLGSVQGNITNYLNFYGHEELREVFCVEEPNTRVAEVDLGVLLCLSMPQKFKKERRYICTILKYLFYTHALRRFDIAESARLRRNLLVLFQDEAQRFAIEEDGNVDVLRECRTTTVMASQQTDSMFRPLGGKEAAGVILGNLRNRVHFSASTQECANATSTFFGQEYYMKRSISSGRGGRSITLTREKRQRVDALELQNLKKFECVVHHADKKIRRGVIPVLDVDGTLSHRFLKDQWLNAPVRAFVFWVRERWLHWKGRVHRRRYSFTGVAISSVALTSAKPPPAGPQIRFDAASAPGKAQSDEIHPLQRVVGNSLPG